jgi:hypothetical protein
MKKVLVYSAALLFFIALCKEGVLMPKASVDNATYVTAFVEEVLEGKGEGDIVLKLRNDPAFYYINRGLERGLQIKTLKTKIESQEVRISYIDDWSFLDPGNQMRHISSISMRGEQVYAEFTP